jgi:hypothetical protein
MKIFEVINIIAFDTGEIAFAYFCNSVPKSGLIPRTTSPAFPRMCFIKPFFQHQQLLIYPHPGKSVSFKLISFLNPCFYFSTSPSIFYLLPNHLIA